MLKRKIDEFLETYFMHQDSKALLLTGARQTGKTYSVRAFGKTHFESFVEINFLENTAARSLFENAQDTSGILLRLSAVADKTLIKGKTLIFFDEVQECPEIVTAVKFLVEEGSYRYILSGSLLGVTLNDVRSIPVGYMDIKQLFPLDFEEFCTACGVSGTVLAALEKCFTAKEKVDDIVHAKMMELFRLYLLVGGMPAAVDAYLETNNLQQVAQVQDSILTLYKKDISKYDPEHKLYIEEIFNLIPPELNEKNKRFILKNLNENLKFSRYENSFLWLRDAGVALPVYCVEEPKPPLMLSRSRNLFKLFLSDVGLLACQYAADLQIKILRQESDINFGSVYENAAAQELKAHGFELYYFNSKKQGELDFLVEQNGSVIPIEIKSGKQYERHNALCSVLSDHDYHLQQPLFSAAIMCIQKGMSYIILYI
jgi:predicted AAA+ superfamily ATPase